MQTSTSLWGLEGLDESRFRALTSLFRLRNGGQLEAPVEDSGELQYDAAIINSSTVEEDDGDSIGPQTFTNFDEKELKRRFLDRVAELVSNVRGGPHVAGTLLVEWPEKTEILVAKNGGCFKGDRDLLETLQTLIRVVARSDGKVHPWLQCVLYDDRF